MTTQAFDLTAKQKEIRAAFSGPQTHGLVYGGSRSGKTFFLVYAILTRALKAPGSRHLIVRRYGAAARQSIALDTLPNVRRLAYPDLTWKTHVQDGYFELPNGSEVWIGGLDDKERVDKILGKEYATLYFNEASEIPWSSYEVAQTRLAQSSTQVDGSPLALRDWVDLNPTTRDHWTYKLWREGVYPDGRPVDVNDFVWRQANPLDNADNIPHKYIAALQGMSERTRKRFFEGEYSGDDESALWRRTMIRQAQRPDMTRVVIAIDPAVSNDTGSDETGIVAVGLGVDGKAYVLDDASGRYKPEEWARMAVALYRQHDADRIVAEKNQGGDMVESVIRTQMASAPVTLVHASRGKVTRAEPVSALYERGRVLHCGEFSLLEDQMCLAAGTMVETMRGQVPIEAVVSADFVMTRTGWAPVKDARETGVCSCFVVIETTDGRRIECTPTHPIYDALTGKFVPAGSVQAGMRLDVSPKPGSTALRWRGAGDGITAWRRATSAMRRAFCSTALSGWRTLGQYLRATTSTIWTATLATTGWITFDAFRLLSTSRAMSRGGGRQVTAAPWPAQAGAAVGRLARHASTAGQSMQPRSPVGRASARMYVGSGQDQPRLSRTGIARIAGMSSLRETQGGCIAVERVTTRHTTPESVFNIEVEGGFLPEFYANGVLVHNCSFTSDFDRKAQGWSPDRVDALVWGVTALFPDLTRRKSEVDWSTAFQDSGSTGWMGA